MQHLEVISPKKLQLQQLSLTLQPFQFITPEALGNHFEMSTER